MSSLMRVRTAIRPLSRVLCRWLKGVGVKLNGNYLYSDVPPTVVNDRTLVPMRAIFEALNAEVTWDGTTNTAQAKNSYTSIQLTEGQTQGVYQRSAV